MSKRAQIAKLILQKFSNKEIALYFKINEIEVTAVYIRQVRHQMKMMKELAELRQMRHKYEEAQK